MGEEGEGGDKNINLLADTMLVAAGGWGLQTAQEHPYAAVGFGLFAAKGMLGIIGYISEDENLKKLRTEISKLAKNFGIPFFVTEMTSIAGCLPKETAAEYFIIPLMDIAWKYADKEFDKNYLMISHSHALGMGSACMLKEYGPKDTAAFNTFLGGILINDLVDPEYRTLIEAIATVLMWAVMEKKLNF